MDTTSQKNNNLLLRLRLRDVVYFSILLFSSFLGEKTLSTTKKNYQNIAQELIDNKDKKYVVISTRTKAFIDNMAQERGLDKNAFVVVSAIQIAGMQDYMVLCGTEKLILTIPVVSIQKLNSLLKSQKHRLTKKQKRELQEIEFFIGHELHHIKLCLDKNKIHSSLYFHKEKMHLTTIVQGATWVGLRFLGVDVWWQLLLGAKSLGHCVEYVKLYFRCSEESECDLNASQNPEVLKTGAVIIKNHLFKETEGTAKNVWGGLLWRYSEELAYCVGTQHPSPKKRSENLLKKAQKLEDEKDFFVLL